MIFVILYFLNCIILIKSPIHLEKRKLLRQNRILSIAVNSIFYMVDSIKIDLKISKKYVK
jgi:hypothetical protein